MELVCECLGNEGSFIERWILDTGNLAIVAEESHFNLN